jgi:PEP-CTERM motif
MPRTARYVIAALALGVAAMAAAPASATALYSVQGSCFADVIGSPTPVSRTGTCPTIGFETDATASQGHAAARVIGGSESGSALAIFSTMVEFIPTNGPPQTSISVALHLTLSGVASSSGVSFTQWRAFGGIANFGNFDILSEQDLTGTTHRSSGMASDPTETLAIGSDKVSGPMTTNAFDVPVGVPLLLSFELSLQSGGTSDMEFLNSLDLPRGTDVFTLPNGFTVNDDSGIIVNNRFGSSAVPEPSALLLLASGLLSFAAFRRRT